MQMGNILFFNKTKTPTFSYAEFYFEDMEFNEYNNHIDIIMH